MDAERIIPDVWAEMEKEGLVDPEHKERYLWYFGVLYVGGYNEGASQGSHRKKVAKLDDFGNVLAIYESASEAANKNGVTKHMISKVCLGYNSKAGERRGGTGFIYKYIDDGNTKDGS